MRLYPGMIIWMEKRTGITQFHLGKAPMKVMLPK